MDRIGDHREPCYLPYLRIKLSRHIDQAETPEILEMEGNQGSQEDLDRFAPGLDPLEGVYDGIFFQLQRGQDKRPRKVSLTRKPVDDGLLSSAECLAQRLKGQRCRTGIADDPGCRFEDGFARDAAAACQVNRLH